VIDRRTFLGTLTGGLLAAPLAAEAQQTGKVYRIGYLAITPPTPGTLPLWEALQEGLREGGYVEGQNLFIERRYSEGKSERFTDFASELVRLRVDVILVSSTPAAKATKQATGTIPIVMVGVGDPVGSGLVASLARPGGNVTGLSSQQAEGGGKAVQLLHEVTPGASPVAVIWDPSNPPHVRSFTGVEASAQVLRIEIRSHPVRTPDELEIALAAIERERAPAFLPFDSPVFVNRRRLVEFAARNRLPAVYATREYAVDGGLMSYGPSLADLFRRGSTYVAKILKGATDLPVEQPTKFELVINLKTAKALGLTIPPSLLARADQVIE